MHMNMMMLSTTPGKFKVQTMKKLSKTEAVTHAAYKKA